MTRRLLPQRLTKHAAISLLVYAVAFLAVYLLAFGLRFNFNLEQSDWLRFGATLPGVLIVKLAIFYTSGLCHRSWRTVAFSDLALLMWTATLSSVVIAALDSFTPVNFRIPRIAIVLDWMLTIFVLGGLQALLRLAREEVRPIFWRRDRRKAFIVGANQSGETLARHLNIDQRLKYDVVGFLDQNTALHGTHLGGIPVLGLPEDAPRFSPLVGVADILVISGTLVGKELRTLMDACSDVGLTVRVIPAVDDLLSSDYQIQIRDVDINDLLRREPVQLNSEAISGLLEGRTLLITGAGGSIGSEICRQVLRFRPKDLVMVERSENNLFLIEQELRRLDITTQLHPCVADIVDYERMKQVFVAHEPNIVFHAAAHKHVPMMEYNPGEAIKNNVLGTRQLVELSEQHGVHEFVMISTDKAVNPTSVMGVSKHIAERFVHAFSETSTTKFAVVRFGNVLASAGSVVPIFQEQIRRGGPITVTHPEIERYFMTIPEASQLVLQAAAMGKGGEIFVLDMGEPVRIVDLAKDLIRLSGLSPDDIAISITGLRPGEKLYEELYFDDEEMQPTPHPKVFVAYHRPFSITEVQQLIAELMVIVHEPDEVLRQRIKQLIPEYRTGDEPTSKDVLSA